MKTVKISLSALLITLLMLGCEDKDAVISSSDSKKIMLEVGEVYTINKGDRLINEDENTTIEVTHLVSSNIKQVKVISGSAALLRDNFQEIELKEGSR